ncbi:putative membrane protein [Babesia divergens]|uniref:Membrane protein n=1 Tax=Babesia divergens TaxID=32595 RepID=A0AAD9GI19_BABDI|nr:putative membrane protein [Babesia divergens]
MYDQKLKRAASFPSSVDTSDEITDEESDDDADVTLFREPDSDDEVEVSIQEAPNKKRGGLSGFLGNLFGFHRNAGNAEKVDKKNGDLSTTLAVALKDLIFGGTVNVSVDKFVNCRDCNANKQSKNEYLSTCGKCRGRGVISKSQRTPFGYISTSRSCVTCSGRGISRIKDCERCSNTGRVHDTSTIPLDIPAGTKPGSTFKVTSRGHSGLRFVKVVSDHDSREYIEDDHVYTCVDVDYVTAMLGGKMDVETFCGSKQINIPPRTQHGDELTLGKYDGMKHVVKFHIVLPKNPSDEELSLLRKINDLRK